MTYAVITCYGGQDGRMLGFFECPDLSYYVACLADIETCPLFSVVCVEFSPSFEHLSELEAQSQLGYRRSRWHVVLDWITVILAIVAGSVVMHWLGR